LRGGNGGLVMGDHNSPEECAMSRKYFGMVALVGLGLIAACATPLGTEPAQSTIMLAKTKNGTTTTTTTTTTTPTNPLAVCPVTAYDSVAVVVGPQGGTIKAGKHTLVIPMGALSQTIKISMVNPGDATASVRFHPEGLQFNAWALPILTLNYKGCSTSPTPSIVYVADDWTSYILEWLSTYFLDTTNKQIQSFIQHFSRYAVAW
jgi:hypothetical protein